MLKYMNEEEISIFFGIFLFIDFINFIFFQEMMGINRFCFNVYFAIFYSSFICFIQKEFL